MRLARPKTIRGRIAVFTCGVLVVTLGTASFIVDSRVAAQALDSLDDRLRSEAESFATLTRFDGEKLELHFEDETMPSFSSQEDEAYFQLSTAQGELERSRSLGNEKLTDPPAEYFTTVRGDFEREFVWSTTRGPKGGTIRQLTLFTVRRATDSADGEVSKDPRRVTIAVQVARSMREAEHVRTSIRHAMSIAFPVAFLLGTLGSFLLARRATRPIETMSDDAAAIASGSDSARIEVARVEGELQQLAGTLNRAFDRLAETSKRERRFSSEVAHELRTPIAIARARLDVALARDRTPAEYREALEITRSAVERLGALVESLLLLARAENERLTHAQLDLRVLVASAADEAVSQLVPRVTVPIDAPKESMAIIGDPALLSRMFSNLVENALSHGAGSRAPRISMLVEGAKAIVRVRDFGIGFPDDLLPRLFGRLDRADYSRSRSTGGAGLGLAIARAIARAHDGDVTARNLEGGGAELRVELPLKTMYERSEIAHPRDGEHDAETLPTGSRPHRPDGAS